MAFVEKINRFCNKLFMAMGGLAVLSIMLLATLNVLLRVLQVLFTWLGHQKYVEGTQAERIAAVLSERVTAFSGSYEIIGFLGAVVIAFALGYTQRRKDHIVVDVVTNRYPNWLKRTTDLFRYPIEAFFFGMIAWQVCRLGWRIRAEGEVSETLKIMYYPFILCVALGFASLTLNVIFDFCLAAFGPVRKPVAPPRPATGRTEVLEEVGGISGEKS